MTILTSCEFGIQHCIYCVYAYIVEKIVFLNNIKNVIVHLHCTCVVYKFDVKFVADFYNGVIRGAADAVFSCVNAVKLNSIAVSTVHEINFFIYISFLYKNKSFSRKE